MLLGLSYIFHFLLFALFVIVLPVSCVLPFLGVSFVLMTLILILYFLVAFVFFFIRGVCAYARMRDVQMRGHLKRRVVRLPRLRGVPARGRGPDALPVQDDSFWIGVPRGDAPVDDGFEVGVDVSHARATGGDAVARVVVQHDVHPERVS